MSRREHAAASAPSLVSGFCLPLKAVPADGTISSFPPRPHLPRPPSPFPCAHPRSTPSFTGIAKMDLSAPGPAAAAAAASTPAASAASTPITSPSKEQPNGGDAKASKGGKGGDAALPKGDACVGRIIYPPGVFGGEAVFVPRSSTLADPKVHVRARCEGVQGIREWHRGRRPRPSTSGPSLLPHSAESGIGCDTCRHTHTHTHTHAHTHTHYSSQAAAKLAEDDGWLTVFVYDTNTDTSYFNVYGESGSTVWAQLRVRRRHGWNLGWEATLPL